MSERVPTGKMRQEAVELRTDREMKVHLRIEIESGVEPISGIVFSGDPPVSRPFTGWLQLTELIADARRTENREHDDPSSPTIG